MARLTRVQRQALLEQAKNCSLTEQDFDKALSIIDRVLEGFPSDSDSLILRGNILDLADRPTEARECYETVLVRDSKNIRALIDMADLEASEENLESALDLYDRAITLLKEGTHYLNSGEELKEVYLSKVVALRESGRLEESQKAEAEARQTCPEW